ncbi:PLP-dependent aminotransferase family protein [Nocardia sp. NBC_01499]|uniref:MocR-like transcription factor YczR n=1 Tax=Nocardia sp. NBC_01499 TaxID=2903597 RepID=UPI0038648773
MVGSWNEGPGPAHQHLSDRLRLLVLDGRLGLGVVLPSERELASTLGTSRTTVGTAYRTLADQRYVETHERARAVVRLPGDRAPHQQVTPSATTIDLSFAAPPAPVEVLYSAYATALEQLPRHFGRNGYDPLGVIELRAAVAYRYEQRGLRTRPDHILITTGAQHALALIARALLTPGDRVLIDHPTYPHAIRVFNDARARITPVSLTETGWDTTQLQSASRVSQLAYLIPDFHNPTGLCMSGAVREQINLSCLTVIDETMADLALDVAPPTPFARHHPTAISIGSASKSIWGGLRIGWIRAHPSVLERVAQIRTGTDLGTPLLEQLATAQLLYSDGYRADMLHRLRTQRQALDTAISEKFPEWRVIKTPGGLSKWAALPDAVSSRLAAIAPDYGVAIAAGPRFGIGGAFERNIRMPYSLPPEQLIEGIHRLARAHDALAQGKAGRHDPVPLA